MKYYTVRYKYDGPDGNKMPWVDDELYLHENNIYKDVSLKSKWPTNLKFKFVGLRELYRVLFNPHALFWDSHCVKLIGNENIEWLPALVDDVEYNILHPLNAVQLGKSAKYRQNEISRNIVEIHQYDFDDKILPSCFMVKQAVGSAAFKAGSCVRGIIVSEKLKDRLTSVDDIRFDKIYERSG